MKLEGRYLITTDNWFVAPNGKEYKSVWGNVLAISHDIGNFIMVGPEDNHVLISTCQIHYMVKCINKPNYGEVQGWSSHSEKGIVTYDRPGMIYMAE